MLLYSLQYGRANFYDIDKLICDFLALFTYGLFCEEIILASYSMLLFSVKFTHAFIRNKVFFKIVSNIRGKLV